MIDYVNFLSAFSDLLINLSAGFLGAAVIIPITVVNLKSIRIGLQIFNILIACTLFLFAVIIK